MTIKEKMQNLISMAREKATFCGTKCAAVALEFIEGVKDQDIDVTVMRGSIIIFVGENKKEFGRMPEYNTPEERGAYSSTFAEAVENEFKKQGIIFQGEFPRVVKIKKTPDNVERGHIEGTKCAEEAIRELEKILLGSDVREVSIMLTKRKITLHRDGEEPLAFGDFTEEDLETFGGAFLVAAEEAFRKEGIEFASRSFMRMVTINRSEFFNE